MIDNERYLEYVREAREAEEDSFKEMFLEQSTTDQLEQWITDNDYEDEYNQSAEGAKEFIIRNCLDEYVSDYRSEFDDMMDSR